MSRIGKLPIQIPENISVQKENGKIKISGCKNQELVFDILKGIKVEIEENEIKVIPEGNKKQVKSNWGTMRSLLSSAVKGLTEGFQKTLVFEGVGYRVTEEKGGNLNLNLGYSHPIKYQKPENIEFEIQGNNQLTIKGFNKQEVGKVAAEIRGFRPVEPYKGKGIRYSNETVELKAGKKGTTGK